MTTTQEQPTQEHLNKLADFRQALYESGMTRARDAQFELLDALLLSPPIQSFPQLSLSPAFRRRWPSIYAAIKNGRQDETWLEARFQEYVPLTGAQVFSLDESAWPHPQARVMEDRQYVYSASPSIDGGVIVAGHSYSTLAWTAEAGSSWSLPLTIRRVKSTENAIDVGLEQIRAQLAARRAAGATALSAFVADGKYGNHRFLGPLRDEENSAVVVKLRRDRVLYGPPGPYSGRGRRDLKHGDRFAFKDLDTWGPPDEEVAFEDPKHGQVRLRAWYDLHAREDATTPFIVILAETHLERQRPSKPLWLAYLGPLTVSLQQRWHWYTQRWPIEPGFRFRKQYLHWTLPAFQTPEACDRWTMLVSLAQWQLFLARDRVTDLPLPWQPSQERLTPERVKQSLAALFAQISTPAQLPKTRGKSPGWPNGRSRTRPQRHPVVKKGKKRRRRRRKSA